MALKTVKDMYDYAKENNIKLLSDYDADFWQEYRANSSRYDRIFYRLFGSFRYFLQDADTHISNVVNDFSSDVECVLLENSKRFSELYKVHVLADDAYDISGNYDVTETSTKTLTGNKTENMGDRADIVRDTIGATTKTNTESLGERSDSVEANTGAQNRTDVNTIAGFNSSGFSDDKKLTSDTGSRKDNSNSTIGAQSNSYTEKNDRRDNTRNISTGKQTNSETNSNTETLAYTKKGNIGVQTTPEIMQKHIDFWSKYDFYGYVFKEISKELLLVSDEPTDYFNCF